MKEGMSIIMAGNPLFGLQMFGPFSTSEEAVEWADLECPNDDWWVALLQEPVALSEYDDRRKR